MHPEEGLQQSLTGVHKAAVDRNKEGLHDPELLCRLQS